MGYLSTFITQQTGVKFPENFKQKYADKLHFFDNGIITTKKEIKIYDNELFKDIQACLDSFPFVILVLHEDGVISKVKINESNIIYESFLEGTEMEFLYTQ